MNGDLQYPADYLHAIRTEVPIELEALSYHSCPFVRARVAARTNRVHVLERLAEDREPAVVANVLGNRLCPPRLAELIGYWMIHSDAKYHLVWYFAALNPHTPDFMRTFLQEKEKCRRAKIREDLKLPPL